MKTQNSNWEEQEQQPAEVVKTKGDGREGGKVLSPPRPAPDKFLFLYLPFVKTSAYSVPPEALRTFFKKNKGRGRGHRNCILYIKLSPYRLNMFL